LGPAQQRGTTLHHHTTQDQSRRIEHGDGIGQRQAEKIRELAEKRRGTLVALSEQRLHHSGMDGARIA
jgi:hypothetical protein